MPTYLVSGPVENPAFLVQSCLQRQYFSAGPEALPPSINTQAAVEHLFTKTLTNKVKALSKWNSTDIQRIHQHDTDYRRISNYLTKQTTHEHLSLAPFSSDLLPTSQRTQLTQ